MKMFLIHHPAIRELWGGFGFILDLKLGGVMDARMNNRTDPNLQEPRAFPLRRRLSDIAVDLPQGNYIKRHGQGHPRILLADRSSPKHW